MTEPIEIQPIPVHITGMEASVQLGAPPPARRRRIVTRYDTVVLDTTNPVRPLLPQAGNRVRATIIVRPVIGGGQLNSSYGWLDDTEPKVTSAAANHNTGFYISAGITDAGAPVVISGQNALWGALDSGATTALTISVAADYYEDDPAG